MNDFNRTKGIIITASDGALHWLRADQIVQIRQPPMPILPAGVTVTTTPGMAVVRLVTGAEIECKSPDFLTLVQLVGQTCDNVYAVL